MQPASTPGTITESLLGRALAVVGLLSALSVPIVAHAQTGAELLWYTLGQANARKPAFAAAPVGATGHLELDQRHATITQAGELLVCAPEVKLVADDHRFCRENIGSGLLPRTKPGRVLSPEAFVAAAAPGARYLSYGAWSDGRVLLYLHRDPQ